MDQASAAALEREQELATDTEDASAAAARAERLETHTALPGIVQEFFPATQTVRVKPAIRRLWIDDGWKDLPECVDVPVQFPRAGNFVLTFPVAAGDECLIVFAERAIDNWWHAGGVQEPSEFRLHDLSDAFAILGFTSKPRTLNPPPAGDASELRTLDGTTVIRLKAGAVELGADAVALIPLLDGVVHGRGVDPFTGAPYYALGNTSSIVAAKK